MPEPIEPLELARSLEPQGGLVFLDSALAKNGSLSLVAAAPERILSGSLQEDLAALEAHLIQHHGQPGALIGYVTYDGNYSFGHYPNVHRFSHADNRWLPGSQLPAKMECQLTRHSPPQLHFEPKVDRDSYIRTVDQAKQYIAQGDIYQVNLTYPWAANWPSGASSFALYEKIRQISPAPFASYLDLAELRVLSSSPECFLHMQGSSISTRPIKGTRPRGSTPEQDHQQATALLTSSKERAELLMITDLLRNDLGQISQFGSVTVPEVWTLESYAQVHHLVSTVCGTLRTNISQPAALSACFPGGSITGAPKKRAMEIIAELEHQPRGLYTGAIGYFSYQGESKFSICIRTLTLQGNNATLGVGSGIVADSVAIQEYEETLHKAEGLLKACR